MTETDDVLHHIDAPLSEAWLKAAGFKWHQIGRQDTKHWLLWVGDAVRDDGSMSSSDDLGIEVADGAYGGREQPDQWFCWLRSDSSHRYSRFIHLRHLRTVRDLLGVIYGVTGQEFDAANSLYGSLRTPEYAARHRANEAREKERLDRVLLREGHPWRDTERDDTRGRALPEHVQEAIDRGGAR